MNMRTHARFGAFGSYGFLTVRRPSLLDHALRLTESVVADIDATCSRFRTDSDLSRANAAAGRWIGVDPLLVAAVSVACEAAAATGGLVNPLLGRTLVELGYDRDLRQLSPPCATVMPGDAPEPETPALDAWRAIGLNPDGSIRVPEATALDLGSTGKAWAADLVAAAIAHELGVAALVSVGGDVRIVPDDEPWQVAVSEDPAGPVHQVVSLVDGGLATSSTRIRRWSHAGAVRHHLLDPRTGQPVDEVWRTVTATGPSCVAANTATTAAIVMGAGAPGWLEERGVSARLHPAVGAPVTSAGWPSAATDPRRTP